MNWARIWHNTSEGSDLTKEEEHPTLAKCFGFQWLEGKGNSDHVLWICWNQGDRLGFVERWERVLTLLDNKRLVKPEIVRMLKNPVQFLDTIAQVEVASILLTKGFEIELEARKSGKTPDIFLIREGVCIEVKNLHMDAVLQEQALSGEAEPVWLRDRLPFAVEEKCLQLADGYPNILAVIAPPEVQFDEFEDFFINTPTTMNTTTGQVTRGTPDGFFYSERLDGSKIHAKLGAVIMWKDHARRYLMNPNAKFMISEELLKKITS
jgi:hypothetical protein